MLSEWINKQTMIKIASIGYLCERHCDKQYT